VVIGELSERIDDGALCEVASVMRVPDVQRLGFLLDRTGQGDLARAVEQVLVGRSMRVVPLRPRGEVKGRVDQRWQVRVNEDLGLEG
jgi:hypothetical protein